MKRVNRIIVRLERYADRPWYAPVVAFLAFIDLFVLVIPLDGVVVTSYALNRRRWLPLFLWSCAGSAAGSTLLAFAVRYLDLNAKVHPEQYPRLLAWVESYGALGLAGITLSPFPLQPAVVFCALSQLPLAWIFGSVFAGRAVKYGFYAWAVLRSPDLLERLGLASGERKQIEEAVKEELCEETSTTGPEDRPRG